MIRPNAQTAYFGCCSPFAQLARNGDGTRSPAGGWAASSGRVVGPRARAVCSRAVCCAAPPHPSRGVGAGVSQSVTDFRPSLEKQAPKKPFHPVSPSASRVNKGPLWLPSVPLSSPRWPARRLRLRLRPRLRVTARRLLATAARAAVMVALPTDPSTKSTDRVTVSDSPTHPKQLYTYTGSLPRGRARSSSTPRKTPRTPITSNHPLYPSTPSSLTLMTLSHERFSRGAPAGSTSLLGSP